MPEINADAIDEDAVLKEVWNILDIEAKTELNPVQIEAVNKLLTLSLYTGNPLLFQHVKTFLILQKSRNRKSMEEFVSVVKAKREDFINKGRNFFNNMTG